MQRIGDALTDIPRPPVPTVSVDTGGALFAGDAAARRWAVVEPAGDEDLKGARPERFPEVDHHRDGGGVLLRVRVDPTVPRAGWAGARDEGLGWRRAGAALAREARSAGGPSGEVVLDARKLAGPQVREVVLGYVLAAHRQRAWSADAGPTPPALLVAAEADFGTERAVEEALAAADVTIVARELAGAPSNIKTPAWLAERYSEVLRAAGFDVDLLDPAEHQMGGLLAVGGGSENPPVLLRARLGAGEGADGADSGADSETDSGARPARRVLLVGKGITFDTGGISIKPAAGMHLMRTDMAGSAAIVAAAAGYGATRGDGDSAAGRAIDLTVLVPIAENMVSGSAYRPGDVVTHYGGRTTEVSNTDAEGRMVLADALAFGVETVDPDVIVDAATLTGAMKVALGMRTGAVFSTSDDLAAELSSAGAATGERWWRLPLAVDLGADDQSSVISSSVADAAQAPKGPGSITAALFLEPFTDGRPWAHLDIAGPARAEEEIDEVGPVATGFGARTVLGWLRGFGASA